VGIEVAWWCIADHPQALPRIDLLILSSLCRGPLHGYELKLELRYKHVRWWAKCEHGHLYASLKRLETRGLVKGETRKNGKRERRVFTITDEGLTAAKAALRVVAAADDSTYFDVDLFIAAAFMLDHNESIALLEARGKTLAEQAERGKELRDRMGPYVPPAGRLIMDHRVEHLEREAAFARRAADALRLERAWGPHLGSESIHEFVARTHVDLEEPDTD
jgi:DNA-binding PadR family transcriptional regulator